MNKSKTNRSNTLYRLDFPVNMTWDLRCEFQGGNFKIIITISAETLIRDEKNSKCINVAN
jgi:hypothetical protein